MLIIIEGPDCAGKTTLALQIAAACGAKVLHRGPPTGSALDEWVKPLEDYVPGGPVNYVCDRWHLGEVIYGPLKRGTSILDSASWTYIDMFLRSRGAVETVIDASNDELLRGYEERGETFVTASQLITVADAYRILATAPYTSWQHMHRALVSVGAIVNEAVALANLAAKLVPFRTYVGGLKPTALILGEKRGPRNRGKTAFMPYPGTSGRYLLEAAPWLGLGDGVGLANALEEDVTALWETLDRPKIVTLGKKAHAKLNELELAHGAVPHPQHVRRFHHHKQREYGTLILRAVDEQEDRTTWPR